MFFSRSRATPARCLRAARLRPFLVTRKSCGTGVAPRSTCRAPAASARIHVQPRPRQDRRPQAGRGHAGGTRPSQRSRRPSIQPLAAGRTPGAAGETRPCVTKLSRTVVGSAQNQQRRRVRSRRCAGDLPSTRVRCGDELCVSTRRRDRAVGLLEVRDDRARHRNRAGDDRAAGVVDRGARRAGDRGSALAPAAQSRERTEPAKRALVAPCKADLPQPSVVRSADDRSVTRAARLVAALVEHETTADPSALTGVPDGRAPAASVPSLACSGFASAASSA